jgi:hypothetical protein
MQHMHIQAHVQEINDLAYAGIRLPLYIWPDQCVLYRSRSIDLIFFFLLVLSTSCTACMCKDRDRYRSIAMSQASRQYKQEESEQLRVFTCTSMNIYING